MQLLKPNPMDEHWTTGQTSLAKALTSHLLHLPPLYKTYLSKSERLALISLVARRLAQFEEAQVSAIYINKNILKIILGLN